MKLKQKLMAALLTLTMMGTYLLTLGNAVIAVSDSLLNQTSKTNHSNVEFNSYFEGEQHSKTFEIGKEAKLYLKIKVSNTGYLKDGVVQFSNANFEVDTNNLNNDNVQSSSGSEIKLRRINNSNSNIIIEIPIAMLTGEEVDSDLFSKIATTTFTGTYVDENGKENSIKKEINNEVKWQGTAEIELAGEVNKFKLYEIGEEKGVLLQTIVKSGIKNNNLPIANTKLEISVPTLQILKESTQATSINPERITVVANTTAGTNGKGSNEFIESNYNYNTETGKIEIEVSNQEENGKISWKKNAIDEYVISYIYTGEEVYTYINEQLQKAKSTIKTEEEKEAGAVNENAIIGEIEVKSIIDVYGLEEGQITKSGKITYSIEEQKGELTDSLISSTNSISKGYIYANYAKEEKESKGQTIEEKKETEYNVSYTAKIYDKTLINEVILQTVAEKYVNSEGEEYNSRLNNEETIYAKTVKIEEEVFNKMLGAEGKIEITDKEGNHLADITTNTEKDTSGNYVVNIAEAKVNEIIIKTSKPITEGDIVVTVGKAITANQNYSKEQMESFEKITLGVIAESNKTTEMQLTEPVSKAEISVGTESLSTVVENKDVELRVVLDTSSYENALYKNPVLQIILPENIETVKIKDADILLDDELKIKDKTIGELNGRKVILITLEGTQTKYMDNGTSNNDASEQNIIAKGANIVIKADITFKKLAPSANSNIILYYTNENSNLYERTVNQNNNGVSTYSENETPVIGLSSTDIRVTSPNGVVTENHMSGYNGTNSISNSETGKREDNINAYDSSKEVNIGGTIVNNYANSIENVYILGRLPFSGNQQIDGTEELGSNFTMKMTSKLTTSGIDESQVKVYYSTNGQATKNLSDAGNNAWTEEPTNLEEVKSYLIVISGEIATGAQFKFDYKVELPESLGYNSSSYTTYKVYYDNKMEDATLGETKVAGTIGVTTGAAPDISIDLQSTADIVREGQVVKMKALVKNKGTKTINNIVITIPVPEKATFIKYVPGNGLFTDNASSKTITIQSLAAGATEEIAYYIRFNDFVLDSIDPDNPSKDDIITEFPREIKHKITLVADDITGVVSSNEYKFSVQDGKIDISIHTETDESQVLKNGEVLTYTINLTNISASGDLTNTIVTVPLPEGTKFKSGEIRDSWSAQNGTSEGILYNESNNTITINIGTLEIQKLIQLDVEVTNFEGDITIAAQAKADGTEVHYSNITEYKSELTNLEISSLTSTPKYVKEGDKVTYTLNITNKGNSIIRNIKISDSLPEELTFIKATYTYNGAEQTVTTLTDGKVQIPITQLGAGETTTIKLIAKAGLLPDSNDKEIKNSMTITANSYNGSKTNEVTNIIEYNQEIHNQIDNNPGTTTGRYKVTGTAWLDENKDGERTEDEELLAGIQVMLIYRSNSNIVTDPDNGAQKIATTNSDGKYEFSNIPAGEYLVVFLYDAGRYSITEYQANSIDASYNSDAINMKIVFDGEQRYAGVTNTIRITNSNARDIDIGLYVAEKFDLRLDKYISKITLTTPTSGTKVYNYDNSKLTKMDFYPKDINNSSMVVEYKIVVTNEGQIPGYVKKIIDYLPEDARFSSELNQEWYISDNNGAVYNTALENEIIEPDQSKEVTLVLSLNITDKNIGSIVNNNAEIYESYNDQGIQDYDSHDANRLESEDDMSSADIMLSMATGNIIVYTILTITIIMLLGFGAYEIKKRVLDKRDK